MKYELTMRPRVALVVDTEDWAFANIARQLEKNISHLFEFTIIPMTWLGEIERKRLNEKVNTGWYLPDGASGVGPLFIQSNEFDLIHVFWREYLNLIGSPMLNAYSQFIGCSYDDFYSNFIKDKCITTAIYDHLFSDAADIEERMGIYRNIINSYYVCSRKLYGKYCEFAQIPEPKMVIQDGVDLDLFVPKDLARFNAMTGRPIVVGWAGNSTWSSEIEDFKGVNSILLPAIKELQSEGLQINTLFADRNERKLSHAEMLEYYSKIDLYICTSKLEGTPNPVLEAMACGVPIISTDVGIVPEVFGANQKKFIIRERTVECLKENIRLLCSKKELFVELSSENIDMIKNWSWKKQSQKFAEFFYYALEKHSVNKNRHR